MLDQSFSVENFQTIYDVENRKGHFLDEKFFPDLLAATSDIQRVSTKARELKRKLSRNSKKADYDSLRELYEEKDRLKHEKALLLSKKLEDISSNTSSAKFSFRLTKNIRQNTKDTFSIEDTPECFFASKQLQRNFRRLYKVKQSDRYNLLCQLRVLLGDTFPKIVFRTDISDFYESIPTAPLRTKLERDGLLSPLSRRFVSEILREYQQAANSQLGLPRGIGISAYLSELAMRDFDNACRDLSGCIFYGRYVDDIVMIFLATHNRNCTVVQSEVANIANSRSFNLNPNKTESLLCPVSKNSSPHSFTYLGYEITFGDGHSKFSLSQRRLDRYRRRLELTFESYHKRSRFNEKKARNILKKRVRFLTGNTELLNSKKGTLIGVYHSNPLLDDLSSLKLLDDELSNKIGQITIESLKLHLSKCSFLQGFKERKFHTFSTAELKEIVAAWKHEE